MQEDPPGITRGFSQVCSLEKYGLSFSANTVAGSRCVSHSWVPSDHLFRARKSLVWCYYSLSGDFKAFFFFFLIQSCSNWNIICSQRFLGISAKILCYPAVYGHFTGENKLEQSLWPRHGTNLFVSKNVSLFFPQLLIQVSDSINVTW